MAIMSVSNISKTYKRPKHYSSFWKSLFSREYTEKHALKNVSFEIESGEFVGLVGPNGAGKSTLVKILTGILYPDSGEANVLGYTPWKHRTEYVKNIGVLFGQRSLLWWDIPTRYSFEFLKSMYDVPNGEFTQQLEWIDSIMHIQDYMDKPVRELSLGEKMKCNLAAALLHNPKILFLDEPTIGLDVKSKHNLRKLLKKINKSGTTILLTTHDMKDVKSLCDRLLIIIDGQIQSDSTLHDLMRLYSSNRVVSIKTRQDLDLSLFSEFHIISSSKNYVKFEVDTTKHDVIALLDKVKGQYGILDVSVSEPDLESIIKKMW